MTRTRRPPRPAPRRRGAVDAVAWRRLIRQVFERDGWRCVACRTRGPLQAHHIHPRSQGGPDHPSNLVSLCPACHATMDGGRWKHHVEAFESHAQASGHRTPA